MCEILTLRRTTLTELVQGRTYEEMDMLFEQKTKTRKFKTTVVDPYHETEASTEPKVVS